VFTARYELSLNIMQIKLCLQSFNAKYFEVGAGSDSVKSGIIGAK